jgi:hypothetical protein
MSSHYPTLAPDAMLRRATGMNADRLGAVAQLPLNGGILPLGIAVSAAAWAGAGRRLY